MTAARVCVHGGGVVALHKFELSEVLVSRASIALIAVVFMAGAAQAEVPATASPPQAAETELVEEGWGLAGDALTVGAAGLGAALGLTAAVSASGPASSVDWRLSLATATLPIVLPAGFAAGARTLQPRRSALNIGLPTAGAAVGSVVGIAALFGGVAALWGPTKQGDGPAIAVIGLSTVTIATMATTAGAVALAHAIEGE